MANRLCLGFLLLLFSHTLYAGTTGKIAGKVTDRKTGETLTGTNIIVVGTTLGAATDANGDYVILNVDPGVYQLRVTMVGYGPQLIDGVQVSIDLTTTVDVALDPTEVEVPEIVVVAERPMVEKTLTFTKQDIGADVIGRLPIAQVSEVVSTLPGVVVSEGKLHLRGGRAGEEQYLVDGGVVNNPLFGGSAVQISPIAIKDLEVVSGTFSAEYGNALSGIINQVLKEGSGDEWNFSIGARSSLFSQNNETFGGVGHFKGEGAYDGQDVYGDLPDTTFARLQRTGAIAPKSFGKSPFYIFDLTLGGPLADKVRFFASGRLYNNPTGFPGQRNWYASVNPKLTFRTGQSKVSLFGTYNYEERPYDPLFDPNRIDPDRHPWWSWKYNLDAFPQIEDRTWQVGANFTYPPTAHNYFLFRADYLRKNTETFALDAQGNKLNYPTKPTYAINLIQNLQAGGQGYYDRSPNTEYAIYSEDTQSAFTFEGTYVDQVTTSHQIKAGAKFVLYSIERIGRDLSFGRPNPSDGVNTQNISDDDGSPVNPLEGALYVQDRIELGPLIVNAGVRADYFALNASNAVWSNPFNPFTGPRKDTEGFVKVSPRIGVSHPVGEFTAIHYAYGTFFRRPNFYDMLDNFRVQRDNLSAGAETGYFLYVGNPGLRPEETTVYEVGIQQQLGDQYRFEINGYYKDIDNLVGLQEYNTSSIIDSVSVPGRRFEFQHFWSKTSVHFGSVRGLEFSVEKRVGSHFTGRVSYTLSEAIGTASGPLQGQAGIFNENRTATQNRPFMTNLDFDRPHMVNGYLDYRFGKRSGILSDIGVNVRFNIQSGLPLPIQKFSPKRERAPATENVDLRVNKLFWLGRSSLDLYVQVENLLNARNVVAVKDPSSFFDETSPYFENAAGPSNDLTAYGPPITVFLGIVLEY